ncbi:MAG TPA: SusD/RagB family nutrient-binding outer membrane lipoprotein, partial [Chitinophagaceae bacterium]|nr:SusD/RagB family nutrient-binding outer membrane lipoprotein [Chitinophagaceae bacterium]
MSRILYMLIIAGTIISSCKKITDINVDPTQFTSVMPEATMNAVIRATPYMLTPSPVQNFWELNNWTSPNGRYNSTDMWQTSYVTILENLEQLIKNYGDDTVAVNRTQIARIYRAYIHSVLVGSYGPIPLSQANNSNYLATVMFDTEDSVYSNILNTLKDASSKINVARTNDKLSYDVIYGGDLLKWKKFANTLRLKIALRCTNVLGPKANQVITECMADEANLINSEAEVARIQFDNTAQQNQNPYYWVYSGKANGAYTLQFPKLNEFMLAFLRSYKDPRIHAYYDSLPLGPAATPNSTRQIITDTLSSLADDSLRVVTYPIPYWGWPKANTNLAGWVPDLANTTNPMSNVNLASNIDSSIYLNPARPFILLGYAETLLMKAEAKQLGMGGTQTAEFYYNAGVKANFDFWKANFDGYKNLTNPNSSATAATDLNAYNAYMQVPGIKWGSSATGYFRNYIGVTDAAIPDGDINKIYVQQWMNYFPDGGFDAWCLQRRTWVLKFSPHTNPGSAGFTYSDVPYRTFYPSNLVSLNPKGYEDALGQLGVAMGAEAVNNTVPLKFMAPHTVINWDAVPAQYDLGFVRKWYGS